MARAPQAYLGHRKHPVCDAMCAVMKQLLLLTFVAFASEAMAQDAQCVPERAAMVETIRVYARLEADVLGPQGISESVLEAMGKTQRHLLQSGAFLILSDLCASNEWIANWTDMSSLRATALLSSTLRPWSRSISAAV